MHKISFIYISLILYCPLSSPGAAPAHAYATTIILTKKNPPTYLELDRLLYAKEDENDITACSILNEIKNQYHHFDFSLSKCALKKCTLKQIKALGIAQLTKYTLSQKFCDLCTASKNFWSLSTTNHKKIKACIADPLFDVNHPTIDGILPLHHSPCYPLELLYTDVTALDAQGNSVLHIYCHTGDIRPLLHSQYRAHIKKIINLKNDESETALLILAQHKIAKKPIVPIQFMRVLTYPPEKADQLSSITELLICGADPDIVNKQGVCFSQLAAQYPELAQLLAKSSNNFEKN